MPKLTDGQFNRRQIILVGSFYDLFCLAEESYFAWLYEIEVGHIGLSLCLNQPSNFIIIKLKSVRGSL